MTLHNDTRIKSYTYEKLHVWKVTRMKNYTLHFIRVTFDEFCPPRPTIHKGQWRGALMFSLICGWINVRVNNREAGDLRRHRAHYDFIVMNRHELF